MDHDNKHYKKLKVKRKKIANKTPVCDTKLIDDIRDEENFKIKRFMKDVTKFCNQTTVINEVDYKACGDGLNILPKTKGKCEKIRENGDCLNICKDKTKEKGYKRRDGLFQRGVMTKGFNKGLMPPSLSARINEDLQKMIELANGKSTYKPCYDDKTNEEKLVSIKQSSNEQTFTQEFKTNNFSKELNSLNINNVETKVEDSHEENVSDRTKCDLYLQFSHFVTRSLFKSGIDKKELKRYSDSVKGSLLERYQRIKHSKNDSYERSVDTPDNCNNNYVSSFINTPDQECSTQLMKIRSCPSSSKSEIGPEKVQFTFTNDSQLSDDIVIRKPIKKMYASGLDYLKAVYSDDTDKKTNLSNVENNTFSPIQEETSYSSLPYRNKSSDYTKEHDHSNRYDQSSQNPIYNINSDKQMTYRHDYDYIQDSTTSLRYFPGNINRNKSTFSWENSQPDSTSINHNTYIDKNQNSSDESPKYISLLPPSHRFNNNLMNNVCYTQYDSSCGNYNESIYKPLQNSLLSLPVHLPPRKSPNIQYLPRKMF